MILRPTVTNTKHVRTVKDDNGDKSINLSTVFLPITEKMNYESGSNLFVSE